MAPDPRATLLRNLRKTVRVRRRMSVEYVGGKTIRYTCTTCGQSEDETFADSSPETVRKLAGYQAQGGGVAGTCKACLKTERDRRYPLK